jgi:hypothetical protein
MTSFEKNNTIHPLMASAAPQGPPGGGAPPAGGGRQQGGAPPAGGGPGGGAPAMGGGGGMIGGGPGGQQQAQAAPDFSQKLSKYVLPSKPITDSDIAGVRTMIDAVCAEITSSIKSAKVTDETIKTGVLGFRDWLKKQGCVANVTIPYTIESADKYGAEIFAVYPGQLPFHFEFKMTGSANKPYRLLLFITKVDGFSVASLVGNRTTITGVPMPKDWPENPWTYWNNPV